VKKDAEKDSESKESTGASEGASGEGDSKKKEIDK